PDADADRFAEGSLSSPTHDCAFVRPEGGWQVIQGATVTTVANFDAAKKLAPNAAVQGVVASSASARPGPVVGRTSTIKPLGKVWYGLGCGSDHATSRDAVAGISLGLAFAHELVDDPAVRSDAGARGADMVRYLLDHNWQITVPPGD